MKNDRLDVKNLVISCHSGRLKKDIVKSISFSLHSGESLAIVGESGCGKTMTAMSLFQLLPTGCRAKGEALLNGKNLLDNCKISKLRGREIVLIPQNGAEFLDPVFKIRNQIFETLRKVGVRKENREVRARELLSLAGFSNPDDVLDKYPFEISGGMAQRVILAIGMAAQPRVVIADEPTRGIDGDGVENFLGLLETIFADTILVIITHNMRVAAHCDRLLVMLGGEVMEYGCCHAILENTKHPYSVSLIRNLPTDEQYLELSDICTSVRKNQGGCPYYTRCGLAQETCANNFPELTQRNGWKGRCHYA